MSYELANFTWSISTQDHRQQVYALENELLKAPQPVWPVESVFSGGMYARALSIPKNGVLTGAIHKQDHFSVLLKGEMTVTTASGPRRVVAGEFFPCKAGTKRAGFAHEESVWLTIERTDETEVESAQAMLVTNDYEGWLKEQACLPQLP
jgi:quercetin dioxygenase-like cupin family protein